jgi:hypothetical protein
MKFLLDGNELLEFLVIFCVWRDLDFFWEEEVFGLFVFENTASAQKLIIVIGVKVVMTQDLLLLAVLGIRLEERVESATTSPLGWNLILVSWVRLWSAIAHNNLFSNEFNYVI